MKQQPVRISFSIVTPHLLAALLVVSMGMISGKAADAWPQTGPPPPELKLPAFYTKYIEADGYPVVASEKVNDYALKEAAYLVNLMLARRPDVVIWCVTIARTAPRKSWSPRRLRPAK